MSQARAVKKGERRVVIDLPEELWDRVKVRVAEERVLVKEGVAAALRSWLSWTRDPLRGSSALNVGTATVQPEGRLGGRAVPMTAGDAAQRTAGEESVTVPMRQVGVGRPSAFAGVVPAAEAARLGLVTGAELLTRGVGASMGGRILTGDEFPSAGIGQPTPLDPAPVLSAEDLSRERAKRDGLHPANAETVRAQVLDLVQRGRFSEAHILREAYPEAFPEAIDSEALRTHPEDENQDPDLGF